MKALRVQHTADPKAEILDKIGPLVAGMRLHPTSILVAIYKRAEKTLGGIYLTAKTQTEDEYQGKVGLVLAIGDLAFKEDAENHWGSFAPRRGDWVAFNVGDTWQLTIDAQPCRMVNENAVKLIVPEPDVVY